MTIKLAVQFEFVCAWNTGRLYTEKGQRISVWRVWADGTARAYYMIDIDRKVDYYFKLPGDLVYDNSVRELRSYVMECYDFVSDKRKNCVTWVHQFANGVEGVYEAKTEAEVAAYNDIQYPKWSPVYA
jgi:hypothetical protein